MKEVYDIVIVGGGTNSLSIAGYLGKCGLSVCIIEGRGECGGGVENTEPMPGCKIDPHATYLYGGAAPAFEQLELHKFGFRMVHFNVMGGGVTSDGNGHLAGGRNEEALLRATRKLSEKDLNTMQQMATTFGDPANLAELLRSIYWTPPPPPNIELPVEDLPWAKVFRKQEHPLYDDSWNYMSTMELLDSLLDSEQMKVSSAMATWYNGPHPNWKGTAIPGYCCNSLVGYSSGKPRGGMHSLAHALVRCAMHYGAKIYTNSYVKEIIVEDREAKGVILADDAMAKSRKIYADKAILSNTHVKPTFLDLVPERELEADFIERVKGINLLHLDQSRFQGGHV